MTGGKDFRMKKTYYYKLSESHDRKTAYACGSDYDDLPPVRLYEETTEIRREWENDLYSDWWQMGEYESLEDAELAYYTSEACEFDDRGFKSRWLKSM